MVIFFVYYFLRKDCQNCLSTKPKAISAASEATVLD